MGRGNRTMATHVRAISGNVQPGMMEDATRILQGEILPALQELEGYAGADLLVDDNRFMLLARWAGICPILSGEIAGFYMSLLAKVLPMLDGEPTHIRYQVSLHHGPGGPGESPVSI